MLKEHRWDALTYVLLGAVMNAYQSAWLPFVIERIYSIFDYTGPDFWIYVRNVTLLTAVLLLAQTPLRMLRDAYASRRRPRMRQKVRARIYDYLYASDYKFFLDKNIGFIQSQAGYIYNNFHNLTLSIITQVLGIVLGLGIIFGLLMRIHWTIAVIICGQGAMLLIWQLLSFRRRARLQAEDSKVQSKLSGTLSDSIMNFATVKTFASADYEQQHISGDNKKWLLANWASNKFRLMNDQLMFFANNVLWLLTILFCVYLFYNGIMNVAGFALALAAWNRFESQFQSLGRIISETTREYAETKQAWNEIIVSPAVVDKPNAKPLVVKRGEIDMRAISFRYNDKDESRHSPKDQGGRVIKDLSLKIKPGEKIGLVGLSGAGKTTLSHLLLRLFDVQRGGIFIDGQNIKNVAQDSLRKQIAFVPQDPALFNRTLRENIGYARPDATLDEIQRAAAQADIHDFIMSTEHGYETIVGNRGIILSGGQRQRIAIARAILKDAPILILDEATAALDSETEATIQKSFDALMRGRTTVVIAHRLSTLRKMDRIIVMERGGIAEQGAHAKLLAKNGIYAKLWKMQSGGFIQE